MPPQRTGQTFACARCGTPVYRQASFIKKSRDQQFYCSTYCRNVARTRPAEERFWDKVDRNGPVIRPELGPCWIWTAADADRYGKIFVGTGVTPDDAHRFAWKIASGAPIPDGFDVCHICDTTGCVRNDSQGTYEVEGRVLVRWGHLFLGTDADNKADMIAKERQAAGDRSGPRLHPERVPRGNAHPLRLRPELAKRGEHNHRARLTDDQVRYARRRISEGAMQKDVAIELRVSKMTISRAVRGETWSHVS